MFRTVPLSIITSFSLYTQKRYMSYRFADVPSWSCSQDVSKPVWHIPLLCVRWTTPDDGQRNCPKHVEVYFKNKFEKLVHLVGFVIRIYHDVRSPECYILVQGLLFMQFQINALTGQKTYIVLSHCTYFVTCCVICKSRLGRIRYKWQNCKTC